MRFVFPARWFRGLAAQGFRAYSDTRKAADEDVLPPGDIAYLFKLVNARRIEPWVA